MCSLSNKHLCIHSHLFFFDLVLTDDTTLFKDFSASSHQTLLSIYHNEIAPSAQHTYHTARTQPLAGHHGGDPHVEGGLLLLRLQPLALARLPDQAQRLHVVPAVISYVTIRA